MEERPSQLPPGSIDVLLAHTLTPLPLSLRSGLTAVTTLGFVSFFASLTLFFILTWRIIAWARKSRYPSQFVLLIYNLVLADMQQSLAFLLNARWLLQDGILVGTSTCWAQGWFLSTGDLASGVFCFFIGVHTFASVIFEYRLSNFNFGVCIVLLWGFVYGMAVAGVAAHPADYYVRAVAWCWVNVKYNSLRLWLHYLWIFIFEFGTAAIYIALILVIQYRIRTNYYCRNPEQAKNARAVAKLMIVYPITYVICTLPLAVLRMFNMNTGRRIPISWFCFAGAMVTSNGWIDVLLYTMTRRIMLFSDEPPSNDYGIETFQLPFSGTSTRFGTQTTCQFSGSPPGKGDWLARRFGSGRGSDSNDLEAQKDVNMFSSNASTEQLFWPLSTETTVTSKKSKSNKRGDTTITVQTETVVEVKSEPIMELGDLKEIQAMKGLKPGPRPTSSSGMSEDDVKFLSKPGDWK